ncbi:MAG: hypothetical protein AAFN07_06855 [Pseudomonadota bacterium]
MKAIFKAVAATAALATVPAFAIDSSTVPAANQLYISGATATDQALYQITILATNGICEPGTADVYIDTDGLQATDANDQFMVACEGRAGSSVAGQNILIAKESNGGSNNGTRNVARSIPLDFIDPQAPTCATTGIAIPAGGALAAYTLNNECSGVAAVVPDAGVADVEAALFSTTTPADIAALQADPLFQIIFSPAVTLNLYRALQAAQGLTQDDDPANVPNLTRGQLSRIFNGQAFTWDEFFTNTGAAFLPGEDVYVCRRGNDSGTQASFAAFVLNERCNTSVTTFVAPDDLSCLAGGCDYTNAAFGGDFIFAGDGSGDVRDCLDDRFSNDLFGIGVLSTNTEINDIGATSRQFRFIGIDGAAPTLQETANGGYHFVTENVLNTLRVGGPTGTVAALVNEIGSTIGTPSIIADINVDSQNPGGDHGILGRANGITIVENPAPVSIGDMRSNPVSSFARDVGGSTNNCEPVVATPFSQIIGGGQ